jgi:hypothetical protein
LARDRAGQIHVPDAPGLGIEPDLRALKKYLRDVEFKVDGQTVFASTHSDWDAIAN